MNVDDSILSSPETFSYCEYGHSGYIKPSYHFNYNDSGEFNRPAQYYENAVLRHSEYGTLFSPPASPSTTTDSNIVNVNAGRISEPVAVLWPHYRHLNPVSSTATSYEELEPRPSGWESDGVSREGCRHMKESRTIPEVHIPSNVEGPDAYRDSGCKANLGNNGRVNTAGREHGNSNMLLVAYYNPESKVTMWGNLKIPYPALKDAGREMLLGLCWGFGLLILPAYKGYQMHDQGVRINHLFLIMN